MQNYKTVWADSLKILQGQVSAVAFDLWIKSLEPIAFRDGTMYLSTTSETAKNRVLKLHSEQILNALKNVSDEVTSFEVLDPEESQTLSDRLNNSFNEVVPNTPLCNFNAKYTFDNFVVGKSNQVVYGAATGVANHPFTKINPLFIYGGVGLGKTHLLHAIGNYLRKTRPELNVLYVTCNNFTTDYVESLKSGNSTANSSFRQKYRNVDVLMVDDIQFISNKTGTQEEFFHTFNDLYQNNKQIIIASDRPPKEIATLEERLRSRFSMGLIQDIQTPDYETRLAILEKKCTQENYNVSKEVINYIAEISETNIREMEGMLNKVHFLAELQGMPMATMDIIKDALKDEVDTSKQSVTPDRIVECVCKYFNISKEDITGKKKNKEIVEPRQIAMYLIYEMLDLPLMNIGAIFGGRDHTTVIHAKGKIEQMVKENNRVRVCVNDLKSMINRV